HVHRGAAGGLDVAQPQIAQPAQENARRLGYRADVGRVAHLYLQASGSGSDRAGGVQGQAGGDDLRAGVAAVGGDDAAAAGTQADGAGGVGQGGDGPAVVQLDLTRPARVLLDHHVISAKGGCGEGDVAGLAGVADNEAVLGGKVEQLGAGEVDASH